MKIYNTTKATIIAQDAIVAKTFLERLRGLIGRDALESEEALVIERCNAIHMFFMQFAVDALFVDNRNCVVGCVENLRPCRMSPIFWKASFVVETPAGTIQKSKTVVGDFIESKE